MEGELAAGKSLRYRIRALRRRMESNAAQCRLHASYTQSYAKAVIEDQAEIRQLEEEIARGK